MVEKLPLDLDKKADINQKIEESIYDSEYWTVSIPNLPPDTDIPLQFAWVYEDGSVSDYSAYKTFTTPGEDTLKRPKFLSTDLTVFQGKLKVNWQGVDVDGDEYGKEFGYVDVLYKLSTESEFKSAGVFIKSSFLLIPGTPKLTYNVKLVAYTKTGVPSLDSDIQTKALIQTGPNTPTNVQRFWSGTKFVVTFTQNPSAVGNEYIKTNKITLTSSTSISFDFEFPVVPGDTQRFELGEDVSNTYFGPQTSPGFSGKVWSTDIYNGESVKVPFDFLGYTSILTAPVITLSQLVGGYKVSYSDQLDEASKKAFNNISIEESLVSATSGFNRISFGSVNPVTISTGSSTAQRWVRALVYDNIGGYPKNIDGTPLYSNVATVTPKDETTDLTPPAIPSVAAGTPTATTIPITVTVADVKTTTISIRYKVFGSAVYSYETILNPAISTNAFTLTGLTPGTQYVIDVAGAKSAQIFSAYSTAATATTSASTITAPTIATQPTALDTTSGFYVVWNASTSTNSTVTEYKIELYKGGVLSRTEYSGSLSISFTGLAASTSYYVKINGINNYGISSTQVQSNAITTNAQGGISDGVGPTANPLITSGMVKSLFGSFAITFPSVANADALIYEVFIKPTNGTGIVDNAYKVLEVGGTFAVIKTLADRTTNLSYGTDYYIAVRAKDIDGVSTGAVTTVGPIQTLQVANADLAADSVFANNIKAGSIVASKIDADNLLASKLITVGAKTANISSATVSGGNIVYTAAAHGFTSGQQVTTSQLTTSTFNVRDYLITAITTDTFTVVNSSGASGTISNQTGYASQIGTNAIRIDATRAGTTADPFKFYAGAGAYATSGTPFYLDSNGKFSLSNKIYFDNASVNPTLTVNGVINATEGDITGALKLSGGTMKLGAKVNPVNIPESGQAVATLDGIYLNDNNYWLSTSGWMKIGSATSYVKWNGTLLDISGQMKVTGSSTITGTLQINGGAFVAGSALTSGSRVKIDSTGIRAFDGNSTTDATGITTNLFANAAAGGVTFATERGRLGSSSNYWLVGANTISSVAGGGSVTLESSSTNARIITSPAAATSTSGISGSGVYGIWSGAIATSGSSTDVQIAAAPFSVTHAGALIANSATIRGKVTATSGGFGPVDANGDVTSGWRISSKTIQAYGSGEDMGTISGGKITGSTITASSFTGGSFYITKENLAGFSGVITVAEPDKLEDADSGDSGSAATVNAGTQTITMSIVDGLINSTGSLMIKAANTLELYGGSAVAASFSSSGHSIVIPGTNGLYIGNTSNAQGAAASSHPAFISIDGRMRLRVGAPLYYPNGSTGAYIRNIYVKSVTSSTYAPPSSVGHIGDIMVTY